MANSQQANGSAPGPTEDYIRMAKELKNLNEYTLAVEVLDKALKKHPDNSNIFVLKAQVLVSKFKKEAKPELLKEALRVLEQALKLDPESYTAKLLAAQILLKGRAYKQAGALLRNILKRFPDDEKAAAMIAMLRKETGGEPEPPAEAAAPAAEPKAAEPAAQAPQPAPAEEEAVAEAAAPAKFDDTAPTDQWVLDDQLVIDASDDAENLGHLNLMGDKLTMFGRIEGLNAMFIIDGNGQMFKSINRGGVNENVIPSMVSNLYRASVTGMKRTANGSFQRGTLVTPVGTFVIVNAFYATLALALSNDANMTVVEARIQRYLEEISE
ncbi:MAG: tetratricopeptide repeat protein [Nitrospinae bacterium]|nr:tetratricopeptide repeat protein [Nitrospinota bacterium]